ncbi:MAG: C13 family peptidase [Candidatus Cryptobacteroides sp.]
MRHSRILAIMALIICFNACSKRNGLDGDGQENHVFKVAVVCPEGMSARWSRTAQWALDIFDNAQKITDIRITLNLEWLDEEDPALDDILKRISSDEGYAAIIGPSDPDKAAKAAIACQGKHIPVILPQTANAEFQRVFAKQDYVFCMTQNDIMQAEIMMSLFGFNNLISNDSSREVALIVGNDSYSDSFRQWFGYLATEKYINTAYTATIEGSMTVEKAFEDCFELSESGRSIPYIFFAPSSDEDFIKADRKLAELEERFPVYRWFTQIFCTDICVSDRAAASVSGTYEGVDLAPNPESGFNASYRAKFGEEPLGGEPQLFDAIYILHYALAGLVADKAELFKDTTDKYGVPVRRSILGDYIVKVVDGRDSRPFGWFPDDVTLVLISIEGGSYPDLTGVSSDLTFDSKYHCAATTSTYRHWRLHNGEYATLEYLTADGSDKTVSSIQNWTTQVEAIQDLEQEEVAVSYPPKQGNYAVIVAASKGWENYRHQADALAMYRLLKDWGYDDGHIILIAEDDIAYNENNLCPGVVKVTPDGENLYSDVVIDYKMSNLSISDLRNIFTGRETASTPEVLTSAENDNVLVFWSGHGDFGELDYDRTYLSGKELDEILDIMEKNGKYRKMMFVIEACYSGSVAQMCLGHKGTVFITAANNSETSKADMRDEQMHIYLSNGFTRAFQEKIGESPDVTLRDLYYHLVTHTVGSHASMYNQSLYGNVFTETMSEYFVISSEASTLSFRAKPEGRSREIY